MKFARLVLVLSLLGCAGLAVASDDEGRGYLGVTLSIVEHTDEVKKLGGVYIDGVMTGSAAEAAGLRAEDRIVALDGVAIGGYQELHDVLAPARPGDAVAVSVLRDGVEQTFTVVLGERPERMRHIEHIQHSGGDDHRWAVVVDRKGAFLGVRIEDLGPQLAEYFGVEGGVLVTEVFEGGPAALAGLQAGDVLTEIEEHPLGEHGMLQRVLAHAEPGDELELRLQRRSRSLTVFVEAGTAPEHSHKLDLRKLYRVAESADGTVELVPPHLESKDEVEEPNDD